MPQLSYAQFDKSEGLNNNFITNYKLLCKFKLSKNVYIEVTWQNCCSSCRVFISGSSLDRLPPHQIKMGILCGFVNACMRATYDYVKEKSKSKVFLRALVIFEIFKFIKKVLLDLSQVPDICNIKNVSMT